MDTGRVTSAVAMLRAQGRRPSVRNVRALIGGSFRDLTRLLKEAIMMTETPDMVTVVPRNTLDQARQAVHDAEAHLHAVSQERGRLRRAQLALEPAILSGAATPAQRRTYHELYDAIRQQDGLCQQAKAALAGKQREVRQLATRAAELPRMIASYEAALAPEGLYGHRIVEAERRLALFRREYEAKAQELAALEGELHALTGEARLEGLRRQWERE